MVIVLESCRIFRQLQYLINELNVALLFIIFFVKPCVLDNIYELWSTWISDSGSNSMALFKQRLDEVRCYESGAACHTIFRHISVVWYLCDCSLQLYMLRFKESVSFWVNIKAAQRGTNVIYKELYTEYLVLRYHVTLVCISCSSSCTIGWKWLLVVSRWVFGIWQVKCRKGRGVMWVVLSIISIWWYINVQWCFEWYQIVEIAKNCLVIDVTW